MTTAGDERARVNDASISDDQLLARAADDLTDAAAQFRLGVTLQALGHFDRSIGPLRRASLMAPTDPNAWFQISIAFSSTGRTEQAEAVGAVLRELKPKRPDMWFDGERDEAIQPLARLSRAAFFAFVLDNVSAEQELTSLIGDLRDSPVPRVQATVGYTELALADLLRAGDEPSQARSVLDDVIARLGPSADVRARTIVANALLSRAGFELDADIYAALATWAHIGDTYREDEPAAILVARALNNIAIVSTGQTREDALAELVSRFGSSAEPELRRKAVNALLARDPSGDAHLGSIDTAAEAYREDPDATIRRASAQARAERWFSRRPRLAAGLHGRALRGLITAFIRGRYRNPRGVDYADPSASLRRRRLGAALVRGGTLATIAAIAAGIVFSIGSAVDGERVDPRLLACGLVVAIARLATVLGARIRGRFTVDTLALAPARLPGTIFSVVLALAIAPITPAIERTGAHFVYGPVGATYHWFGDIGFPEWARIAAMVPVAPVEVILMVMMASIAIVWPARFVFGRKSPVTKALEESFGSIDIDHGPDYA